MEIHKNDYESGLDAFIDCIYEKDPGQELLKKQLNGILMHHI